MRNSRCWSHEIGHWRLIHWSRLRGRLGVSAPTSITTTVRRDPYRVTAKLEPDTSFGSQAPHGASTSHADRKRSPCWGSTKNSGRLWAEATQFEQNPGGGGGVWYGGLRTRRVCPGSCLRAASWVAERLRASSRRPRHPFPADDGGQPWPCTCVHGPKKKPHELTIAMMS